MITDFKKDEKDVLLQRIRQYFEEERAEEIGDLAAENLLRFISEHIGPAYYNQGVRDAQTVLEQTTDALDEELYSLQKPFD